MQGGTFPEITRKVDEIKEILDEEEESFSRTLDRGEKLFDDFASKAQSSGSQELNGKDVWRLYDTFGFPVDLTRLMAEELNLDINEKEFEEAQALSKEASKGLTKKDNAELVKLDVHDIAFLDSTGNVAKTDDSAKFSQRKILCLFSLLTIVSRPGGHFCNRESHLLQQIVYRFNFGNSGRFLLRRHFRSHELLC